MMKKTVFILTKLMNHGLKVEELEVHEPEEADTFQVVTSTQGFDGKTAEIIKIQVMPKLMYIASYSVVGTITRGFHPRIEVYNLIVTKPADVLSFVKTMRRVAHFIPHDQKKAD